ncbi:MAG: hypothetical protein TR69_WS6001000067 [candidate division WS6 bacterium OLB20]|uniref:Uncharacterized protein n=1 Tax=candidate division WS6 bacterium OLB20 TaxID=1617426 RepID=A0A136M153_9BACT|nr:MAG: hypothetical protein TR69_WS6001000067 [candidate division WS6 bacterium OLB20]
MSERVTTSAPKFTRNDSGTVIVAGAQFVECPQSCIFQMQSERGNTCMLLELGLARAVGVMLARPDLTEQLQRCPGPSEAGMIDCPAGVGFYDGNLFS